MTPPDHMALLLRQWQQLTRAESAAIQAAAWPEVRDIQSRKASLRQPLTEAFRQWKSSGPAAAAAAAAHRPVRAQVAALLALEAHNARLLALRRERARQKILHLERAAHNLRNLRRSYVPPAPPAACNSYS
ncbi:MAG: hypothetical protein ABSG04_02340 [Verrucomicrobiota bacterium]|jgi:hypothetical protein